MFGDSAFGIALDNVIVQTVFFFVVILFIGYVSHHIVYWIDISHRERFEEEYGNYKVFRYLFKNSIGVRIFKMSFQSLLAVIFGLRIRRLRRLPLDELPPMFYHREKWYNFWLPEDSIPAIYVRKPRWFNLWGKIGAYVLSIATTILAVIIPVVTMWIFTPVSLSTVFDISKEIAAGGIGGLFSGGIGLLIKAFLTILTSFTESPIGYLCLISLSWWFGVKLIVPSFQNMFSGFNFLYFIVGLLAFNSIFAVISLNLYKAVAEWIFAVGVVMLLMLIFTFIILLIWSITYLIGRSIANRKKWSHTLRY